MKIFNYYKSNQRVIRSRIVRKNVIELGKVLRSKSETKIGLSSYYLQLYDTGRILKWTLKIFGEFEDEVRVGLSTGNPTLENDIRYLLQ